MTNREKYPRTYHLPWSHPHSDDKSIDSLSMFDGKEIVVLEKLDGENTTIYSDGYLHARSIDSRHNFTRNWARKMSAGLCHDIPKDYRFVFENVAYYHSIHYQDLESFCYLISIWDDQNYRLAYDDVKEYADILDLAMPREFYRGPFDEAVLRDLAQTLDLSTIEGYVVSSVDKVHKDNFSQNIAKFVRNNHVQPNHDGKEEHWLKNTRPNKLRSHGVIKPSYMGRNHSPDSPEFSS